MDMLNICCDLHILYGMFREEQRLLTKVMLISSRCTETANSSADSGHCRSRSGQSTAQRNGLVWWLGRISSRSLSMIYIYKTFRWKKIYIRFPCSVWCDLLLYSNDVSTKDFWLFCRVCLQLTFDIDHSSIMHLYTALQISVFHVMPWWSWYFPRCF